MKHAIFLLLWTLFVNFVNAQIVEEPTFDKKSSYKALNIEYIDLTDKFTKFNITYTVQKYRNPNRVMSICISKEIYLQDVETGKTYKLKRVKGAKKCPKLTYVGKTWQTINFDLIFEPIEHPENLFHLLEPSTENQENSFNIYKIIIL